MAPPRPYWKGYLKLSLVSCPIALYTATSPSEQVAFRQINKKTGNRLRQQLIDEESGEPIDPDDKGRGYEVEKGVYLRVEDEELEAIAIESSHTIDIDCFVPKAEIDERYIDSPYYLVPENKVALEAFAVIRDAMRDKSMVAFGRVVLSKREHVVMLQPRGKGLLGTTLRYPYEIRTTRSISAILARSKSRRTCWLSPSIFSIAKRRRSTPRNSTIAMKKAVVTMLNEKKAGMPVAKQRPMPRIVAGTDLMAALRQSIDKAKEEAPKTAAKQAPPAAAAAAAAKSTPAPKGKRAAKGASDQREMLLPIAGGAPAKEAVEKQATQKPGARKGVAWPSLGAPPGSDRRRVRDIDADVAAVIDALDGRQRIWLAAKLGAGIPWGSDGGTRLAALARSYTAENGRSRAWYCAAAGPEFEIGEPHVGEDAKDPHAFKRHEEVAVPEHRHVECSVKKRLSGSQKLSG